ncbi:MAG: RedB protein [Candidatus Binataceae bacterium]
MRRESARRWLVAVAGLLWLSAAAAGFVGLWNYSTAAGVPGQAPAWWPADSRLPRDPARFTLLVMAHPKCPCTRATIGELATLMAQSAGRVRAIVVFEQPPGVAANWAKSDLWFSAREIPDVSVVLDDNSEARRFGAATSGQTMVYDAAGRLVFSGGITAARGHWGDNAGQAEILALADNTTQRAATTPVFGCPLFGASARVHAGSAITCRR